MDGSYDFAVIGGGGYGLSTACCLAQTGSRIILFEKFDIGHSYGSSHGDARISRYSLYSDPDYQQLNIHGTENHWPNLEKKVGVKLLHPAPCYFYYEGSEEIYESYRKPCVELYGNSCLLENEEILKKFPFMPDIPCHNKVIVDEKASIIDARSTIQGLFKYLKTMPNVTILQNCSVASVEEDSENVAITLQKSEKKYMAKKAVVTSGHWVTKLIPEISDIVITTIQYNGFLKMENMEDYKAPNMPSVVKIFGENHHYLVPDFKGKQLKLVFYNEQNPKETLEEAQVRVPKDAQSLMGSKMQKVERIQECHYTLTKTTDFIIDWVNPKNQRVLVASCCSGHGFKFIPILGSVIADLLIKNKSIDLFEKCRHKFCIAYHREIKLKDD